MSIFLCYLPLLKNSWADVPLQERHRFLHWQKRLCQRHRGNGHLWQWESRGGASRIVKGAQNHSWAFFLYRAGASCCRSASWEEFRRSRKNAVGHSSPLTEWSHTELLYVQSRASLSRQARAAWQPRILCNMGDSPGGQNYVYGLNGTDTVPGLLVCQVKYFLHIGFCCLVLGTSSDFNPLGLHRYPEIPE